MTHSETASRALRPARISGWKAEFAAAVLAAMVMVAIQAAGGLPTLFDARGDNDNLMRLVQIRDWLGGQGWSDLHQYRMGPEGGFLMHWSRIVDAPVAAIMLAAAALTGSAAMGEMVASVLWPAMLFAAALFLILHISISLHGDQVFLPALLIGGITLNFMGIFTPRALDHHNLQLVLALATMALLLRPGWRPAALAGLCCAAMLAIGLETLPYVAVAGLYVALAYLASGRSMAGTAIGFGAGFAVSGLAALLAFVPFTSWWSDRCDAYSAGLAGVAVTAGTCLAIAAALSADRGLQARLSALALAGVVVAAAAVVLAPQCFGDPYAGLEPRLRSFWLDDVVEAQPLWGVIAKKPAMAPQHYLTALLALVLLAHDLLRNGPRPGRAMLGAFLFAAFAVSVWQVRGSTFSLPFAVIPLAAWVADWRRIAAAGAPGASLKMVLAWLVSLNLTWSAAAFGIAGLVETKRAAQDATAGNGGAADPTCYADAVYAGLAAQPATTVLAISNLGAAILAGTQHSVLAGPYHRNVAGNLLVLDAFMGPAPESRALMKANGVGLLAMCRGNGESQSLASFAPNGLMAELLAGKVPDWLEEVPASTGGPLQLYRVR